MSKDKAVASSLGRLVIISIFLAGTQGCSRHTAALQGTDKSRTPQVVEVAHPRRLTLTRTIEQPARIEAFEQAPIHVKIPGYVEKVYVEIGSRVRKGDLLADLWVPELKEELKHKLGLVAQARIDISLAEKTFRVAQASARTAQSLVVEARASLKRAEANYQRWKSETAQMERMVREKIIAGENREAVIQQFKSAEAAREEVNVKIESAEAAHEESMARMEKAQADVSAARNQLLLAESAARQTDAMLQYARITAPFDGVVSERHVDTGHFLQPSSGPSPSAQPLFVVVRTDKVRVFLEVPEADAILVKYGPRQGSPAHIRVPVLNDREFTGRVVGTSWSLDAGQRTLRTEIDFDNPEELLRPGMYAHAIINAEKPDAWTIPSRAIITRDGQTFCYCLVGGTAVRTLLKIGFSAGAAVEVLKKQQRSSEPGAIAHWVNFLGTESVITNHVGQLIDGQKVDPASGEPSPAG